MHTHCLAEQGFLVVAFDLTWLPHCTALPQLRASCNAANAATLMRDALGSAWLDAVSSDRLMLGVWGSADELDARQWVRMDVTGWPALIAPSWDEGAATCRGMPSGLTLRILTGVAFAANDLQAKLLYARACFGTADWVFDRLGPGLQAFKLRFDTTFVPVPQPAPAVALRPAPPLSVPLPPDLLYPFTSNAAASSAHVIVAMAVSLAMLTVLL